MELRRTVGKHIQIARVENDWNQEQLADKLHTTQKAISRWEKGKVEIGIVTLARIAELFEKPVDWFYLPVPKVEARRRKAA